MVIKGMCAYLPLYSDKSFLFLCAEAEFDFRESKIKATIE